MHHDATVRGREELRQVQNVSIQFSLSMARYTDFPISPQDLDQLTLKHDEETYFLSEWQAQRKALESRLGETQRAFDGALQKQCKFYFYRLDLDSRTVFYHSGVAE